MSGDGARVSIEEFNELLKLRLSDAEMARRIGCTRAAVGRRKRRLLNAKAGETICTPTTVKKIVTEELNTIGQLKKINRYAHEMLDLLMRWQRGEPEALQVLESQVKMIQVGKRGKDQPPEWIREIKFKDPRELALRAMGEIRQQLDLELKFYQALYDVRAGMEFQEEVLRAIGEESQDVRDRIVARLRDRQAIRASIRRDKPEAVDV